MKFGMLLTVGLLWAAAPGFANSLCDASPGNLVVNCGFETGDFTGWTVTGNDGYTFVAPDGFGGANSGNFYATFGSLDADTEISQTFTDVAGQEYVFSFYYASTGDVPHDFTAEWDGVSLLSSVDTPQQPYTQYSFNVVGTGSDEISFFGRNSPSFESLDDVVVGVPESSSAWIMLMLVGACVLWRSRRVACRISR